MVRMYQPDVIIDNRLEGSGEDHGSIATAEPSISVVILQVRNSHSAGGNPGSGGRADSMGTLCDNEQPLGVLQF